MSASHFVSLPTPLLTPTAVTPTNFSDECHTSEQVWDDLLPLLPRDAPLVDPFNGARFAEWGAQHGLDARAGFDFWGTPLPPHAVVVSNPPYSIKEEVVMELADRGVPFVLIMPFGLLRMGVMNRIPDFKVVFWGEDRMFTRATGEEMTDRHIAVIHGLDAPQLTFIQGDATRQQPTYMCRCGCRVKRRSRAKHSRTHWHRSHAVLAVQAPSPANLIP